MSTTSHSSLKRPPVSRPALVLLHLGITTIAVMFWVLVAAWSSGLAFPPVGFLTNEPIALITLALVEAQVVTRALKKTLDEWSKRGP